MARAGSQVAICGFARQTDIISDGYRTKARHIDSILRNPSHLSPGGSRNSIACFKQIYYKQQSKLKQRQKLLKSPASPVLFCPPVQWQLSGPSALDPATCRSLLSVNPWGDIGWGPNCGRPSSFRPFHAPRLHSAVACGCQMTLGQLLSTSVLDCVDCVFPDSFATYKFWQIHGPNTCYIN